MAHSAQAHPSVFLTYARQSYSLGSEQVKRLLLSLIFVLLLSPSLGLASSTLKINQATANEISQAMTGVGEKKALAIVEYRDMYGDFKTTADLMAVKGIGAVIIEKNLTVLDFSVEADTAQE